jgi:hypothetical protein
MERRVRIRIDPHHLLVLLKSVHQEICYSNISTSINFKFETGERKPDKISKKVPYHTHLTTDVRGGLYCKSRYEYQPISEGNIVISAISDLVRQRRPWPSCDSWRCCQCRPWKWNRSMIKFLLKGIVARHFLLPVFSFLDAQPLM